MVFSWTAYKGKNSKNADKGSVLLGAPTCTAFQRSGTANQGGLVIWYCPVSPLLVKSTNTGKDGVLRGWKAY